MIYRIEDEDRKQCPALHEPKTGLGFRERKKKGKKKNQKYK